MPEGPSIVIARELAAGFAGRAITRAEGNTSVDKARLGAWKNAFVLKPHWLVPTKRTCPRCGAGRVLAPLGQTRRRSFFYEHCQKKDAAPDNALEPGQPSGPGADFD